jgi:flagellar hook protein FlgE
MSLIGTLTSGVSALKSFTKDLEVIGNNIANVNTTAYKGSTTSFEDSFSNTMRSSAPSSATTSNVSAIQVGSGVQIGAIQARFTQGSLSSTGVSTDLGVSGSGFFQVVNPADGSTFATRAGDFRFDDQGYLVTTSGYRVQGLNNGSVGDIKLGTPPTGAQLKSFSFDGQGKLVEYYSDGTNAGTNQVLLQSFRDPSALQRAGDNLFTGFTAAGPVGGATLSAGNNAPGSNGLGKIESGTLELSNVDLTEQFANMIAAQRSFQASSRVVTVSDSVLEEIVNLKR